MHRSPAWFSSAFDWQNATRRLRFDHPNPAVACDLSRMADPLRQMSVTLRALAAIVVGCIFSATAHAARVAILSNAWSAETAANFSAKIAGDVFTGIDVSSSVPPLATLLANYDVVLLFEDTTFVNATAVGNRVAEFSNAGRAVVLGTFLRSGSQRRDRRHDDATRMGNAGSDRSRHDRWRRDVVCGANPCAGNDRVASVDARRDEPRRAARQSGAVRRRQSSQAGDRRSSPPGRSRTRAA